MWTHTHSSYLGQLGIVEKACVGGERDPALYQAVRILLTFLSPGFLFCETGVDIAIGTGESR